MNTTGKISIISEKQRVLYTLLFIGTLVLYFFSLYQLKLEFKGGWENVLKALSFAKRMLLHMDLSDWKDVLTAAMESISIAVLATIISATLAFFVSFAAASNVSLRVVSNLCKAVAAVVRAVPTLIWTLIFVAYLGLGPFPGVLGLFFHSFAYLVKAFSQSIEEVKEGNIEALKATGASWVQTMAKGVYPPITTAVISWTALRFEFNLGMSSILGFVGAGGIGMELSNTMRIFDFEKAGFVVLIIFLMSFSVEMLFHKLKLNVDKCIVKDSSNS
ncbi:MAG: phnE [Peptococcaceae bacterium]|nr:phnE [Peptococcaceae bacterium]